MTADPRYALRTNEPTPGAAFVVRADDLTVDDVLVDGATVSDVHVGQEIEPGRRVVYVWTDVGEVDAHVADDLVTVTTSRVGRDEIEVDRVPPRSRTAPDDALEALEASVGRYTLAAVAAARDASSGPGGPRLTTHVLAVGIAQGFAGGARVTSSAVAAFLPHEVDTVREALHRLAMEPPSVLERETAGGRSLYGIPSRYVNG